MQVHRHALPVVFGYGCQLLCRKLLINNYYLLPNKTAGTGERLALANQKSWISGTVQLIHFTITFLVVPSFEFTMGWFCCVHCCEPTFLRS